MSHRPMAPLWPVAVPPESMVLDVRPRGISSSSNYEKRRRRRIPREAPIVCRFAGAGPRPQRADDARDRRRIREGSSDLGRRGGERPCQRALVRRHLRREVAGDSAPWPVRKDPRRRLVETRSPLGRHRDRMGTERWSRLRPDRGDGAREGFSVSRHPSMDSREEHLAETCIDLRAPPICPDGELDRPFRLLEQLLYDKEFWVQRAVGTWLRECWKEDRSRTEAFLRKHARGLPRIVISVATERAPKTLREELRRKR